MASLGQVQAIFAIDARKAISSLKEVADEAERTEAELRKLDEEPQVDGNVVKWAEANKKALLETGKLSEEQARKIAASRASIMESFAKAGASVPRFTESGRDGRGKPAEFTMPNMGNVGQLSGNAQAIFNEMRQGANEAEQAVSNLTRSGGLLTVAMNGLRTAGGVAAAGIGLVAKAAGAAVLGVVGFANALKYGYKAVEGFVKKDPTLDMFRRVEEYQSKLAKLNASASHQDTGLSKGTYDRLATEFASYANVTKTEALEIAKNLTLVGNVGQKMGAKIRQGTKIGEEAIKEVDNVMKMLPDYAAVIGKNFRDPKELMEAANNLRIAFSSMDNLKELASHYKLFTDEQQKSIENTVKLKGEAAGLEEAFSYLPKNLEGTAEKATTALEKGYDKMTSTVRTAWDKFSESLDWDSIGGSFGTVLENIGNTIADFINGAQSWGKPLVEGIANGAIEGINLLVNGFNTVKQVVSDVWDYLGNSSAFQSFVGALGSAVDLVMALGEAFVVIAGAAWDFTVWSSEVLGLNALCSALYDIIADVINIVTSLVTIATDGWKLIIQGCKDLWATVSDSSAWNSLSGSIGAAIDWFANLYNKAAGFIGGITNAITGMFSAASGIVNFVKERAAQAVGIASGKVAAQIEQTGTTDPALLQTTKELLDNSKKTTESIKSVDKNTDGTVKELRTWKPETPPKKQRTGGGGGRGGKSDADKQAERDAKNAERYLKNLREQAQEISRMTKLERLHYDLQEGAVKLSGEQLKQAEEFARAIDDRVRLQRQERVEIELANQAMQNRRSIEDSMRNISNIGASYNMSDREFGLFQQRQQLDIDYQRQLEDLAHRERQELVGKSNEEIQVTRDKYRRLRALAEDYHNTRVNLWQQEVTETEKFATDIAANVRKGIKEVGDWYNSLGKDIQNATVSWAERCSDAIATFVRKGKFDFKSLADSILDDVTRMASRQFTSGLFSLFGSLFGGGGGYVFDSGFNSLIGLASGGYTGHGGKYQPAGIVHKGEFVINANSTRKLGLDFLNALNSYATGGYVTPLPSIVKSGSLDESNHLGGGVTVNVYNQTNSQVTARRNNTTGAIDVFVRQAVDAVADSISTGGIVANAMQNTYALNRGAGTQRTGF